MPQFEKTLFIFRRDLRIEDNTALSIALEQSLAVMPCFIFDPRQVEARNTYRSLHALQFMLESLHDLERQLEHYNAFLYIFYGKAEDIVAEIIARDHINALYLNRDYTPFSIQRDTALAQLCTQYGVSFFSFDDVLLQPPEELVTHKGLPYRKFTPFYQAIKQRRVRFPQRTHNKNYWSDYKPHNGPLYQKITVTDNQHIEMHGGRTQALRLLSALDKQSNYQCCHNFPLYTTTRLSAHLKFGTISVREMYRAIVYLFGIEHVLIRQLYWRDFFTYIAWYYAHIFNGPFYTRYNNLVWDTNYEHFKRWCSGETGVPIVDAGMRHLNTTGYMPNRMRLITASFLVKDLHINWQEGERYFARMLIDYDPSINNGNWQWIASTGADAQPYFRIFNPWLQQKKFDPDCHYIKQWVPELAHIESKRIHQWEQKYDSKIYYAPIVQHAHESKISMERYGAVAKKV